VTARLRPFEQGDLEALYDVCVRTAANGDDLTQRIGDPLLPGHVYAAPYCRFEPGLAFVVEDELGVGGYIVGTDDTSAFEARCGSEWWPALRSRYPAGSGVTDVDRRYIALIHQPPPQDEAIVGEYPAHLHIDLLPRLQGQGWGRTLVERFTEAVGDRGATGVHLGVGATNHRAFAFYRRVGFRELRRDESSIILGRRLDDVRGRG
jgi:ribosomal protein S18 acetylase RimI-like enzyme